MERKIRGYFNRIFVVICAIFSPVLWASDLQVDQAFARETVPGMQNSAAYLRIKNFSGRDAALVGVTSPDIGKVEMHQHLHQGGMMAMRPVAKVVVPGKGEFSFKPGGHHLMLMGLQQPLAVGEEVTIRLLFEDGREIEANLPVTALTGQGGSHSMQHDK